MFSVLVIATHNQNKLKEFKQLFAEVDIEIRSLADFGPLPVPIEDGVTFDENAYKKALHTAKVLGIPALADDSGLVVDSLNGAPGVYSARYAGEKATDLENCEKLLQEMDGVTDRTAAFHCVLSIAVPSGPALTYEASCSGEILKEMQGDGGFGYDPLFFYPPLGKTFAQLDMSEKNKISHRGQALAQLAQEINMVKKWLEQRMLEEMPEQPDHSEFLDNDWSTDK